MWQGAWQRRCVGRGRGLDLPQLVASLDPCPATVVERESWKWCERAYGMGRAPWRDRHPPRRHVGGGGGGAGGMGEGKESPASRTERGAASRLHRTLQRAPEPRSAEEGRGMHATCLPGTELEWARHTSHTDSVAGNQLRRNCTESPARHGIRAGCWGRHSTISPPRWCGRSPPS